ncbi:MAG TPA: hypothetical protein VKR54_00480 [Candidatus Babeliales bacterium]|nr:hypothetical protein [Candidatus Babeliales bacterium]
MPKDRTNGFYIIPVRGDASVNLAVNAALSPIRDCSNPVRSELVEGSEHNLNLSQLICSYGSTRLR